MNSKISDHRILKHIKEINDGGFKYLAIELVNSKEYKTNNQSKFFSILFDGHNHCVDFFGTGISGLIIDSPTFENLKVYSSCDYKIVYFRFNNIILNFMILDDCDSKILKKYLKTNKIEVFIKEKEDFLNPSLWLK